MDAASAISDISDIIRVGFDHSVNDQLRGESSVFPHSLNVHITASASDVVMQSCLKGEVPQGDFSSRGHTEQKLQERIHLGFYVPFEIILTLDQGGINRSLPEEFL